MSNDQNPAGSREHCDYAVACTPGTKEACARVAGRPNAGCLCGCHIGNEWLREGWSHEVTPVEKEAHAALAVIADRHGLVACDPDGGECMFPRCIASGCEAEKRERP